jgi:aconitase B
MRRPSLRLLISAVRHRTQGFETRLGAQTHVKVAYLQSAELKRLSEVLGQLETWSHACALQAVHVQYMCLAASSRLQSVGSISTGYCSTYVR